MQVATCSSGAVWGSVSCSKTLRHAAGGARDSNQSAYKNLPLYLELALEL